MVAATVLFAAPIVAEIAADRAVQAAAARLESKTLRRRVAKRVAKDAPRHGITIKTGSLKQWMQREDVREQLESGSAELVQSAVDNLAWRLSGTEGVKQDEQARTLLALVLFHLLAESDAATATAFSARWTGNQIAAEGAETRGLMVEHHQALVDVLTADSRLGEDLRSLHPWRAEEARSIAETWKPIGSAVHSLVTAGDDRGAALAAWGTSVPRYFDDAPAEAWCWLGQVATDYGAGAAGAGFFLRAIELGAHPRGYWYARAAMSIAEDDPARAREFAKSGHDHPLARAIEAELDDDLETAGAEITAWSPANRQEQVIRDAAYSKILFSEGQTNAAIAHIERAAEATPEGAGLAATAAELLLRRADSKSAERPADDAQRALAWAIKARNNRRAWAGDSTTPVLLAVKATALLNDFRRGFRLTQAPPEGEATPAEAADVNVLREAAIMAVGSGRDELAAQLAERADDPYSRAFVAAVKASRGDGEPGATDLWRGVYEEAPTDGHRLQAAYFMLAYVSELPDLRGLEDQFPAEVGELRSLHGLPTNADDRLAELRTRAPHSARMTVELASHYSECGDESAAGQALEEGGHRWSDAILMRMAAEHYWQARDYVAVQRTAEAALRLATPGWGGETDTRKLLFEAYRAQGNGRAASQEAGRLVALDAKDADARWAYVYCLAREGDLEGAWNVLTPDGDPVPPRDRDDVRAWVSLLTRFDQSPAYLRRVLDVMTVWQDDEEIVGVGMAQVYSGLGRYGHDPAEADIAALHAATEKFLEKFPESTFFTAIPFDPEDPLGPFADGLQDRHEALEQIETMVRQGKVPVGMASSLFGRTYTEAMLQRLGGMIRSHDATRAAAGAAAADDAIDSAIAIDLSAAATLAAMPPELASALTGRFQRLETTDVALNDAMNAQTSLGMRSDLTVVWDKAAAKPRPVELDHDEVEALATRSTRVTDLLTNSKINSRPTLTVLTDFVDEELASSLSTLDYAAEADLPFWCDDLALLGLAVERGVKAFGTADLVRQLAASKRLDQQLAETVEANLVVNFHVDLGFRPSIARLAADLDGWRPAGAAFSLSRPPAWTNPNETMPFLLEALSRNADRSPEDLRAWVAQAALGLTRGLTDEQASSNLRILLAGLLRQVWMRPDRFPAVLQGVRAGLTEHPAATDPLEPVLEELHAALVEQHEHAAAAYLVMTQVQQANEADRLIAARVVLAP